MRERLSRKKLILEWLGFFASASALIIATAIFQPGGLSLPRIGPRGNSPAAVDHAIANQQPEPARAFARSDPAPSLPQQVLLEVPFSPQAPFGDWSQPWADACEETSVSMAMAWVRNHDLTPDLAEREILNLVDFETYHFGYHRDTALRETQKLFTRYFGYENVRLAYDISLEDIKRELARGSIVLVPASGRVLARENPYYQSPPPYHMVVVRGYDDESGEIVVNDPGTKRGRAFRYSYGLFISAIHDWTGDEETVLDGRSGMIVVSRESK